MEARCQMVEYLSKSLGGPKLILHATVAKHGSIEIQMSWFRASVGRLTGKRRRCVRETMPKKVEVIYEGLNRYDIEVGDALAWMSRYKAKMKKHDSNHRRLKDGKLAKHKAQVEREWNRRLNS